MVHVLQLEIKDLQQQLRLAEQAGSEARADNARLKQEQQEDSRTTEVFPSSQTSPLCPSNSCRIKSMVKIMNCLVKRVQITHL